ncbi:hypothetical protein GW17_00036139, partial [Ensete ventricosum]
NLSIIGLTEDQATQLLYAFWIQANRADNKPSDFQAIAHSFSLTLISLHLKVSIEKVFSSYIFLLQNSNCSIMVQFFHMLLSLRKISLEPNGRIIKFWDHILGSILKLTVVIHCNRLASTVMSEISFHIGHRTSSICRENLSHFWV